MMLFKSEFLPMKDTFAQLFLRLSRPLTLEIMFDLICFFEIGLPMHHTVQQAGTPHAGAERVRENNKHQRPANILRKESFELPSVF
ncbi:uncharacterized protein PHALS_05091 [Plasmopara halstedii]|uniref:Uncharacterized protein n=1 Tax=Plasmopara halstedii TaxID=4781 RepID=A0A0P1B1E6_PLAHL|nr:uncharacterized protein PHALS_05091 [Plasmopara halstedii]CEG47754.1 hypothetical protein PHALS_05091 [Plasmopara halstedii]|eukprot:XP_024584123.1 hypothetical protein PHALS_05091 [Plasmopara halstedii]